MTEELKLVVDVSKPLGEVKAVAALLELYLASAQWLTGGAVVALELAEAVRTCSEADVYNALMRPLAIVGNDVQVGQFVTASPAYGVYDGRPASQPIIADAAGVKRFKANAIVDYLHQHGGIDMNKLAVLDFSDDDRCQFAQLIGYSVSGYEDLSYVQRAASHAYDGAPTAEQQIIGNMYQIAARYDMPVEILDVLCDPAAATQAQIDAMSGHVETALAPKEIPAKTRELLDGMRQRGALEHAERVAVIGDTTQDVISDPVAEAQAAGLAMSRASALMDDGRRFRVVMRILELDEKLNSDEPADLTKGQQEAMSRLLNGEHRTADEARAVIDGIVAERLLDEEEDNG